MSSTVTRVVGGFIAGALAVLVFHQIMYVILQQSGVQMQGSPWNLSPDPNAFRMPRLVNQMFWGGLWGIAYAWLVDYIPAGPGWVRGLVFGLIFPMLLGSWLLVAMIKGQPLFANAFAKGFDIMRLRPGFFLSGIAFGLGLGLLYPLIAGLMGGRSSAKA